MNLNKILKRIRKISNSKTKNALIKEALHGNDGIFDNYNVDIQEGTRERRLRMMNEKRELYGLSPNNSNSYELPVNMSKTLSTRYVPGMPGVQARRVSDGVVQNPYSGTTYDYNEGFKVDKQVYPGSSPSLQSKVPTDPELQNQIVGLAKEFKEKGLRKESRLLNILANDLKKK